jgi:hypothetical protein
MWARIASFTGGDDERLEQMREERRQSGSMMPDGVRRVMMLSNHEGQRLFVAFFDSREELDAAAQRFESMGDEIPEEVRGRRTAVDAYEVVFDESV